MASVSVPTPRDSAKSRRNTATCCCGARVAWSQPRISLWAISGTAPANAATFAFSLIWFLSRTATAARMPEPYSTVTWPARRCAMACASSSRARRRVGGVGAAGDQVGGVGRRAGLAEQHEQRSEQQAERAARLPAALDGDHGHAVRLGQCGERAARSQRDTGGAALAGLDEPVERLGRLAGVGRHDDERFGARPSRAA